MTEHAHQRMQDRRDPHHPLRRPRDYRPDGSRRRHWSGPERKYRLAYRRNPLTVLASTLLAVLLPATIVIAGTLLPTRTAQQTASVTVGLTIPWAAGGQRYDASGALEDFSGEWPSLPVSAVRLWDTRTAWLNIEPARNTYDFTHLDANLNVASAHGVSDVTMVLWGTPAWAAASLDSNDAPWMGPGSASPPTSMADWEDYVRHVAERYAGRITAYEIGNEPNLRLFWRGTWTQLADMVARAATVIHQVDPAALVVAPALYVGTSADVASAAASGYFTALAASHPAIDALAFHWYSPSLSMNGLDYSWTEMRRRASAAGLPTMPIWVTEVGFQQQKGATDAVAATLIPRTIETAKSLGIPRVYFYAWTDLPIGNLLHLHAGSPLERGLASAG